MAGVTEVLMPQLGETVTEGTITRWLKAPGDHIAEDEDLFEVSTDKVDTTVPSSVEGEVVEILVAEGETVPVGAVLSRIRPVGEPVEAATPATASTSSPSTAPTIAVVTAGEGGRAFLSPSVRRLLTETGLDPEAITGTGADGRITRDDVLRTVGDAGTPPVGTQGVAPAPVASVSTERLRDDRDEIVPLTPIRRRIAENLTRSLATAAHTLVVMEVDYARVDEVRLAHREEVRDREGFGLTYLPFVAAAVIDGLRAFPQMNATLEPDALVVHPFVNLGVAVDLDFEGLIVPVVRDADRMSMLALAGALHEQAERARARNLAADDAHGGTFTITNAGGYGTFVTAPIINQAQVAILSMDGVRMRPVAVMLSDGTFGVAVHPTGNVALSFDHRAFDGAYASAFLAHVVARLEDHDWDRRLRGIGVEGIGVEGIGVEGSGEA